jgi:hypothetical protein
MPAASTALCDRASCITTAATMRRSVEESSSARFDGGKIRALRSLNGRGLGGGCLWKSTCVLCVNLKIN